MCVKFSSFDEASIASSIDLSESAGGSWFTILNSDRLTPRVLVIVIADWWIFSITMFLRSSSMSLVSEKWKKYTYIIYNPKIGIQKAQIMAKPWERDIQWSSKTSVNLTTTKYCKEKPTWYYKLYVVLEKVIPQSIPISRCDLLGILLMAPGCSSRIPCQKELLITIANTSAKTVRQNIEESQRIKPLSYI